MNKNIPLLTAALLLTGAVPAFAASTTELSVTGTITPVACTPTLANGGVVNYDKISAKDLKPTSHTRLEDQSIQLTIDCDAPAQFAISVSDNRKNTASVGNSAFGLGLINVNEKLGSYQLSFINPVGNVPVNSMYSRNKGDTWSRLDADSAIFPTDWVGFGNRIDSNWTPDFLQTVTVDIALTTLIAPANNLTLTDKVNLDGSATLQIEYL